MINHNILVGKTDIIVITILYNNLYIYIYIKVNNIYTHITYY